MTVSEKLLSLRKRLEDRTATIGECLELVGECRQSGLRFDALYVLDAAIVLYPTDENLRQAMTDLLSDLDGGAILDQLIDGLPDRGERLRALRDRIDEALAPHHGTGAPRPASRHFRQCVLIKNICQRIPIAQPIWRLLVRICDHHGRRAAEEAFGVPVDLIRISSDRTVALPIGGTDVRFHISSASVGFELMYFFAFEPGMVRWIAGFDPGDTCLDIGANIGKYSILSAATRRCRTYAVEPFTPNVVALQNNIALNTIGDRVSLHQWAITDRTGQGELSYESEVSGSAAQAFDESGRAGQSTETIEGYRLDDLVAEGRIETPNHIKIDVDGAEHRIIAGMRRTLADPNLKSIRLEIRLDDPRNAAALDTIRRHGFECAVDDDSKNLLCLRR